MTVYPNNQFLTVVVETSARCAASLKLYIDWVRQPLADSWPLVT